MGFSATQRNASSLGTGLPACRPIAEQFLAFSSQKTAGHRNNVIALFENQPARNQTSAPLIIIGTALPPKSGDIFLRDTINHRSRSEERRVGKECRSR